MSAPSLTRQGCVAACRFFVSRGLDYALLPVFGEPHASNEWYQSKVEHEPNDVYNVSIRGRANGRGGVNAFALRVDELSYTPLRELESYAFLNEMNTMRFEMGTTAYFLFEVDFLTTVSEHRDSERIACGLLKGTQIIAETGVLSWGKRQDAYGRSVTVERFGDELQDLRQCPLLVAELKKSGRITMSDNSFLVAGVKAPAVL